MSTEDINYTKNVILGKELSESFLIYPKIREVIKDGKILQITKELQDSRINVETKDNVIIKIVGIY